MTGAPPCACQGLGWHHAGITEFKLKEPARLLSHLSTVEEVPRHREIAHDYMGPDHRQSIFTSILVLRGGVPVYWSGGEAEMQSHGPEPQQALNTSQSLCFHMAVRVGTRSSEATSPGSPGPFLPQAQQRPQPRRPMRPTCSGSYLGSLLSSPLIPSTPSSHEDPPSILEHSSVFLNAFVRYEEHIISQIQVLGSQS